MTPAQQRLHDATVARQHLLEARRQNPDHEQILEDLEKADAEVFAAWAVLGL